LALLLREGIRNGGERLAAALRPRTSSELEITEFVSVEDIDPVYYETSYYVMPEAAGEKAYTQADGQRTATGEAEAAAR
jgi:non-homologous end joining protein Ku